MAKRPNALPNDVLVHLLRQAGWLPQKGRITNARLSAAVAKYQDFHGLLRDRWVGPLTRHHMLQYRYCGHPDSFVSRGWWNLAHSMDLHWGVVGNPPNGISMPDFKQLIQAGWDAWSRHLKIKVSYTTSKAKANVIVRTKKIDGPFGTLGMSELPPTRDFPLFRADGKPNVLDQTYDWDERWEVEVSLLGTITHENGHAWGCPHLGAGNLMQPYADKSMITPQAGDIQEGVDVYGGAEFDPGEPTPGLPEMQEVTVRLYGYGIRAEVVG